MSVRHQARAASGGPRGSWSQRPVWRAEQGGRAAVSKRKNSPPTAIRRAERAA